MENRPYALSAGLFLLLLCVVLTIVTVRMTGSSSDQVAYVVESRLPISGLNVNAPVRLRGVDVGTVKKIQFSGTDPNLILIDISVNENAPLTKGAFAKLNYLGITGLSFIQLDNDAVQRERLVSNPGMPAHISLRPSMLDELSGSGEELLHEVRQTAKRVNILLSDQNLNEFANTLTNLRTASGNVAGLANDLQPTARSISTVVDRAHMTMRRLEPLLDSLNILAQETRTKVVALDHIGKAADDISQVSVAVHEAVPELRGLLHNFAASLRTADRVLSDIEQHPQSILFGRTAVPPGPGEEGFRTPEATR